MGGDYTRFTFDPAKGYAGVLEQQGRVRLDADPNEAWEIGDRRWRSETYDLLSVEDGGPAGRCVVPASTPDAFLVTLAGPGAFTIGAGRAYVDGIQVENFGAGIAAWDPVLAELRRTGAVPHDDQPFLSAVEDHLPDPPGFFAGIPYAVYLDVWNREVDALVDPGIRDVALGGPDTGTRVQTVWQVRALALGEGELGCEDDLPGWDALVAPSAGRLTTLTDAPQPAENPCILSPEGGYRGRENRLYRVEIHAVAGDGSAGLKWSRDNASVKAAVTALETVQFDVDPGPGVNVQPVTRLTVASLGRDSVLRFRRDDWIEVLDERLDLDPTRAGEMARVLDVDEALRTLTLDRDLAALGLFDPTNPLRRTRIVRWDQRDGADPATGLLPVPAALPAELEIEDGISVRLELDPAGGGFHVRDHWLFAARTADSSVEELDAAPPRGVHHHYARLAVIDWPDFVDDCRDPWPEAEEGCCTVVVHPGEDVQDAIDSLPPVGGCVCLKAGEHRIDAPLVVSLGGVHLHGESPGARVVRDGGLGVLRIGPGVADVVVESIQFRAETESAAEARMVLVDASDRVTIRDCRFEAVRLGDPSFFQGFTGIEGTGSSDLAVLGCGVHGVFFGVAATGGLRLTVEDCELSAERIPGADAVLGDLGVWAGGAEPARVRDNRFLGFRTAVLVGPEAVGSLVEASWIDRADVGGDDAFPVFAIVAQAPGTRVRDNLIAVPAGGFGGIHLAAATTLAEENWIGSGAGRDDAPPIGILVQDWLALALGSSTSELAWMAFESRVLVTEAAQPGATVGEDVLVAPNRLGLVVDGVMVAGNHVHGAQHAVVVEGTVGTVVRDNDLDTRGAETDAVGVTLRGADEARVSGNRIVGFGGGVQCDDGRGNRVEGNHVLGGETGVSADREQDLRVVGNTIEGARAGGCAILSAVRLAEVADNRVLGCGWQGLFGVGIYAVAFGEVVVERCEVLDTGVAPETQDRAVAVAWGIFLWAISCRVESNLVSYTQLDQQDPGREDRALLAGSFASSYRNGGFGSALVLGNKFLGPGLRALVRVLGSGRPLSQRFEKVIFNHNHCVHLVEPEPGEVSQRATVRLDGSHLVVMGNHVKATPDGFVPDFGVFSFDFNNRRKVALTGNVTTGDFLNLGSSVPAPPNNFNVRLP